MARIEINQKIRVYERNGKEVTSPTEETIGINAHWNDDNMVILVINDQSYTVAGNDVLTAVANAMNSGD